MRLLNINCLESAKSHLKSLNSEYIFRPLNCAVNSFSSASVSGDHILNDSRQAAFIESRLNLWNKLKIEHDKSVKAKANDAIKVKLKYGQVYEGLSWQSTPSEIYQQLNKNALKKAIVAKVNDELWDLSRPLEGDCNIELLDFENPLAKQVLWHSSAHVLGFALETIYGCLLAQGPATSTGFFYDVYGNGKTVSYTIFMLLP